MKLIEVKAKVRFFHKEDSEDVLFKIVIDDKTDIEILVHMHYGCSAYVLSYETALIGEGFSICADIVEGILKKNPPEIKIKRNIKHYG